MTRAKKVGDRVALRTGTLHPDGQVRSRWELGTTISPPELRVLTVRWDNNAVGLFRSNDANLLHLDEVPVDERWWLTARQRTTTIRELAADLFDAVRQAWLEHENTRCLVNLVDLVDELRDGRADGVARVLLGLDPLTPEERERAQADADSDLADAERELDAAREALSHVEHGENPEPAEQRYVAALLARNAARAAAQEVSL